MDKQTKDFFLREQYPLTIISDRYDGTYSGGSFLAFPLEPFSVPAEVFASDVPCAKFWARYKEPVGRGSSPARALQNLMASVRRHKTS